MFAPCQLAKGVIVELDLKTTSYVPKGHWLKAMKARWQNLFLPSICFIKMMANSDA